MGSLDMGNRYADDIKRIVGIDLNQNVLGAAEKKAAIPGTRGIGYYNPKTGGSEGSSGTPNQTTVENRDQGEFDNWENDSGTLGLDPNFPQNGVGGATVGQATAGDIIDGIAPEAKVATPQITDAGLVYDNNNSLNSLIATDCVTGDEIEIRFRDDFVPPDATFDTEGNELTAEWESADVPPVLSGWVIGTYYTTPHPGPPANLEGLTLTTTTAALGNALDAAFPGAAPWVFTHYVPDGAFRWIAFYDRSDQQQQSSFPIDEIDCISTPPTLGAVCPSVPPTETSWPPDSRYVMKLDEGNFVTSEFDPEVPPNRINPQSFVEFCFGVGRTGTIEVTKDNGVMIYETGGGGAPTGIIRTYDPSGQMIAVFDAASGWINNYRP